MGASPFQWPVVEPSSNVDLPPVTTAVPDAYYAAAAEDMATLHPDFAALAAAMRREEEAVGIRLVYLLVSCAGAVQAGDAALASAHLSDALAAVSAAYAIEIHRLPLSHWPPACRGRAMDACWCVDAEDQIHHVSVVVFNNIMSLASLIHNLESGCVREIKPVSEGEERSSSSLHLEQLKWQGMFSDTSSAESGSDDDFGPSFVQKVADYGCLTPVHEEGTDSATHYSCEDQNRLDMASEFNRGVRLTTEMVQKPVADFRQSSTNGRPDL
ncbi:hypothetical protein EJB05_50658, partial [Eragrostis curvula]